MNEAIAFYGEVLGDCKTEEQIKNIRRELCRGDLFYLMVYELGRVDMLHPWLFARCREVQAEPNGYIDLWAREHFKSSVITFGLTIQDILNDPEITVGIFSYTATIATGFLKQIKNELENNENLNYLFPEILWENTKDSPSWSGDGITVKRQHNPKECTVEAWGLVQGQPTSKHFKLRVYDDIITMEGVSTPEQILKTTDAMDMSDNLGQVGGWVRIIGTRYALGDTYEEYEKRGAYKVRKYPATDNGRVDGNPVLLSLAVWEDKILKQSPSIISSQQLQNPLSSESVVYQSEWFRLWPAYRKDSEGNDVPNELPEFEAIYQSVDSAHSEKKKAAYSCHITFGLFKPYEDSNKYAAMVLDFWMERVKYPDLRTQVMDFYQNKYGANNCAVTALIVEDKDSGVALIPDLRKAGLNVIGFAPKMDKTARANVTSHYVRDGLLWIPESRNVKRKGYCMTWLSAWFEQMTYFPNTKYKDAVDTTTQFLGFMAKTNWLLGKSVPPKEQSYWRRLQSGTYS